MGVVPKDLPPMLVNIALGGRKCNEKCCANKVPRYVTIRTAQDLEYQAATQGYCSYECLEWDRRILNG